MRDSGATAGLTATEKRRKWSDRSGRRGNNGGRNVGEDDQVEGAFRERNGNDGTPPADDLVTTTQSIRLGPQSLDYHATAGRMVISEEVISEGPFKGRMPTAEVFVTAYTADGADPLTRPVVFAFNGGPGSSSV